jgi:hypothetical protein
MRMLVVTSSPFVARRFVYRGWRVGRRLCREQIVWWSQADDPA